MRRHTTRCVQLLVSRRLLSSKEPIDSNLRNAVSQPVSDRGAQVKGAFEDYLKKTAARKDGLWSRLGDDGSQTDSQSSSGRKYSAPHKKLDGAVGAGRIQNQRLYNKRETIGIKPRAVTPVSTETTADESALKNKKVRKGGGDEYDEGPRGGGGGGGQFDDELDGSVQSLLFDQDYFEEMFKEGERTLDYDEMDEMDKLAALSFQESFKSSTNEFTTVLETPSLKRTVLPRARTMKELYAFMQPDIQSVPYGSPGYIVAAQSWDVIQRNMFYSDEEKYKFMETIAKLYNKVDADYQKQTSGEQAIDLIFRSDFRKGRPYFEEEQRLKALSGEAFVEEVDIYKQADTDWNVQAVEDEDQL